ncbi:Acyl-coenzyme A thioesterase THEM4 [Cytospora mali]|uniref:Acyl-coenzyme A thioesterase THEM4 n=1 Tax=Cytospora mali TaxID=578113 RepID=A0A194W6J7_CYTMA|nr:Acyl-coenzyme A thioesterase THEM4 [Valsa mali]
MDNNLFTPTIAIDNVEHFKSIPWCAKHLTAPNLIIKRPWNRNIKPNVGDALYSVTLNTPYTIPSFLLFYPDPDATSTEPQSAIPEVNAFITLGPLVSGFAGVSHGGIVMSILDEMLSIVFQVNRDRGLTKGRESMMTAYLNTTFMQPVRIPGTFLVRARLEKVEGRKWFGSTWFEDANGVKLAKADGLFVMLKAKL